jgi:type IV pilus assembly protein PilC
MILQSAKTAQAGVTAPAAPLDLALTAQFFEMLKALVASGIPLTRALDGLRDQPGLAIPLTRTVQALESGYSLSRAFAIGGFSDPMVLGLLQLGERTGNMDKVIAELASVFRWRSLLRAELKARLTYPVLLAGSCALLVGLGPPLLLRPVLDFLTQTGVTLSAATQAVLALVAALSSPWFWVAALVTGGLAFWALGQLWRRSPQVTERWLLARPVLGSCLSQLYSARFGKALLAGLASGYPLLGAVELAAACSGSAVVQEEGRAVCKSMIAGDPPERAFQALASLDPLLLRCIPLGLSLGAVETLLGAVVRLIEEKLRHSLDALLSLMEPVLLAFMGVLVALCIMATVSPMMSLLQGVT